MEKYAMKDKNLTIGIITYHAAYNFGSVLQAYATVYTLEKMGYDVATIDYQTPSQELSYKKDFSRKKGFKSLLHEFPLLFIRSLRKKRAREFESFIHQYLHLTPKKLTSFEELKNENWTYPILLSGSDQIWNIHCVEFANEPFEAILPYFLKFGTNAKRIAYGSSFSTQPVEHIKKYKELLCSYDFLSTREPITRNFIEEVTGKATELVCDPTWLLTKKEWQLLPLYKPETPRPFIFVYNLGWNSLKIRPWMKAIKELAKQHCFEIICISPLFFVKDNDIRVIHDAGPIDFLSYLSNAQLVITNTFHGTIFSMNFEVPFYSCNVTPNSRQGQMIGMCGLKDRIKNSPSELLEKDEGINFTETQKIISEFRNRSLEYLKQALKE